MSSTRARLEVIEAILLSELSPEEARARRTELLKQSRRGRMLLRIERIEKAAAKLVTLPLGAHRSIDLASQEKAR